MVTCVAPHVLLSVYDSNGFATAIESLKKIAIDRIYILLPEQIIDRFVNDYDVSFQKHRELIYPEIRANQFVFAMYF